VEHGHVLKLSDQSLKFFWFLSYSCSGFSVTPIICSVKCVGGIE
jgi:hypothetical protein